MRLGRAGTTSNAAWIEIAGDEAWALDGDPFTGPVSRRGDAVGLGSLDLLAPVAPGKIVAVARNYRAHAAEMNQAVPEAPLFFLKAHTAVIGPGAAIELPRTVGRVEHEGELALVIKTRARHVAPENALEYVLGYTCLNDVTARELQRALGHFTQAKGYDTFCPLGPWIETELDPHDLAVKVRKNGVIVQDGRTSEMVHPIERLISAASAVFTLEPGDVIATGTPSGVGPLVHGDRVEVEVEGIGALINDVRWAER